MNLQPTPENFTGLTSSEVVLRLKKFGLNELEKKNDFALFKLIAGQFKSPLVYVLFIAGLAALLIGKTSDAIVVFTAVLINVFLGFFQEFKAQKSLGALNRLLSPRATVIRDREMKVIEAKNLVVGDLVVLTIGSRIPADGVLIEATDFSVNEAILTGESVPTKKREKHGLESKTKNLVFAGTIVATGIGKMVVNAIGIETEVGKIGRRVVEVAEQKTPLQIQLGKMAKDLTVIAIAVTFLIFGWGSIKGIGLFNMLTTAVAIAVASIPEGLVVSLTVILALGMERILKRKAIVRRLLAAETLGSVSVICADKTGTLTEGKLRVVKAETPDLDLLVKSAILCNDMRDPLEEAMLAWALRLTPLAQSKLLRVQDKVFKDKIMAAYPRLDEIPFSPKTKIIATLHQDKSLRQAQDKSGAGQALLLVSGAPEVLLDRSKFTNIKERENWLEKFRKYGESGYRLVGFAYKKIPTSSRSSGTSLGASEIENSDLRGLSWLGILVYEDPVQLGVKTMLERCQQAGIKIKVITGDYLPTAMAVLKKLDLDGIEHSLTGEEMEKMTKQELRQKVSEVVLFARINPEQKFKIVEALRAKGETVAMMGDGVNDAPALAEADIGIVVSRASDVAVQTADMVLLDSNFATIVHAIEEGRVIFENIKKVVLYLLSHVFVEVTLIGTSIIFGWPMPVTAAQIIWINLVEDTLPSISLAFESEEGSLMNEAPRSKDSPILDSQLKTMIGIIGGFLNLSMLVLYYFLSNWVFELRHIQTIIFVTLGVGSLFICLACRSLKKSIFSQNPFSNWVLNISLIIGLSLLVIAVYLKPIQRLLGTQPLGWMEWVFSLTFGMFILFFIELTRTFFLVINKRRDEKA